MSPSGGKWTTAWADALAFVAGLALAWYGHWQTRDLVWSLWLSSLLVGYAMIVWGAFRPAVQISLGLWQERAQLDGSPWLAMASASLLALLGGLVLLAFFTVHFGMFHFVHSVFLNLFFPAMPGAPRGGFPGLALYLHVLAAYWPFVLLAAVAERHAFQLEPEAAKPGGMTGMMAPYRNVVRLHLLIFFFAFASFARIDSFAVYAVVYAVYFFPWRLVRRPKAPAPTAAQ